MKLLRYLPLLLPALAACASPGSRIRENQAAFDALPLADREQIRAGEVADGFTETEVLMAKGQPTSKHSYWKDSKEISTWTYTKREIESAPSAPGSDSLAAPYGYPVPGPQPYQTQPTIYGEVPVLTVEFQDGRVTDVRFPEAEH